MDAFEFLDVAHDADERTIKRAYAKRLRQTRPDDDPAGFQQLHTAYQEALWWARQSLPEDDDAPASRPGLRPLEADAAPASPNLQPALGTGTPGAGDDARDHAGAHRHDDSQVADAHSVDASLRDRRTRADADAELDHGADDAGSDARAHDAAHGTDDDDDTGDAISIEALIDSLRLDHGLVHARVPVATHDSPPPVTHGTGDAEPFDPDAFFASLMAQVDTLGEAALARWLAAAPELYDLARKRWIARDVYWRLSEDPLRLPRDGGHALDDCFGIDLTDVRARGAVLRALESGDATLFGEIRWHVMRALQAPFSRGATALRAALRPKLAEHVVALHDRLVDAFGARLPDIDPEQIAFFRRQLDPRYLGRDRWHVLALRALLLGTLLALPVLGILALPGDATTGSAWFWALAFPIGGVAVVAAIRVLWLWGARRQSDRLAGGGTDFAPWACGLLSLVTVIVASAMTGDAAMWATFPGLAALACAMRRFARAFDAIRFGIGGAMGVSAVAHGLGGEASVATTMYGLAFGALAMLGTDFAYARAVGTSLYQAIGNPWSYRGSLVVFVLGAVANVLR